MVSRLCTLRAVLRRFLVGSLAFALRHPKLPLYHLILREATLIFRFVLLFLVRGLCLVEQGFQSLFPIYYTETCLYCQELFNCLKSISSIA